MSLKLYCDLRSPPSRSLYMFLKIINQPFEHKKIDVIKGKDCLYKFILNIFLHTEIIFDLLFYRRTFKR